MKSVTFDARGETIALRLDMNALVRYQERAGESLGGLLEAIANDGLDMVRTRRLFWAALDRRMSEDEAGDLMSEIGLGASTELTGRALRYAIKSINGEGEDDESPPEKPRKEKTET